MVTTLVASIYFVFRFPVSSDQFFLDLSVKYIWITDLIKTTQPIYCTQVNLNYDSHISHLSRFNELY